MTPDAQHIYDTRLAILMDGREGEPTAYEFAEAKRDAEAFEAQENAVCVRCKCGATVIVPRDPEFPGLADIAKRSGVSQCDQCAPIHQFEFPKTKPRDYKHPYKD